MGDKKQELELDWPTFQNNDDNKITYSPEHETEDIFTNFQPATERHNIRNKKRKPKKQKAKTLRLISESEINDKSTSCIKDRCRCLVITILVLCIVIIVAVCIFLGIYFGVILKKDKPSVGTSQGQTAISTSNPQYSSTRQSTYKTLSTVRSTSKIYSTILPSSSSPLSSSSTPSTSTSTTTSTTSTTTTTTTTTTPAPAEPSVREYTGSEEDTQSVISTASKCVENIIITTNGLTKQKKCESYSEMLRCVYINLVSDQLYVPTNTLIQTVEQNWDSIFPVWIEITPELCRDADGKVSLQNISSLPRELKDLCSSADALALYGRHDCKVIRDTGANLSSQTDMDMCRILWGTLGCVADKLSCPLESIDNIVMQYGINVMGPLQLEVVNTTMCTALFKETSSQFACEAMMYSNMVPIYFSCSRVIKGSGIVAQMSDIHCSLFETFFGCSYGQIPEMTRYETCNRDKDKLRQISYDIAMAALKVNRAIPFVDVTSCIDNPMQSTYICQDTTKLLAVVDTVCFEKFRRVTSSNTVCRYLKEYIYDCGITYIQELGMTCSIDDIKDAVIKEGDLIFTNYGIDVKSNQECIESGVTR